VCVKGAEEDGKGMGSECTEEEDSRRTQGDALARAFFVLIFLFALLFNRGAVFSFARAKT